MLGAGEACSADARRLATSLRSAARADAVGDQDAV